MTTNIMQSYINRIEKFLKDFNKVFFLEEYDKEIEKNYIETYIDARIYNFGEEKQRYFYRRIFAKTTLFAQALNLWRFRLALTEVVFGDGPIEKQMYRLNGLEHVKLLDKALLLLLRRQLLVGICHHLWQFSF